LAKLLVNVSISITQSRRRWPSLRLGHIEGHCGGVERQSYTIDRRKIQLEHPIKQVGEYKVPVKLHKDVTVEIPVTVTATYNRLYVAGACRGSPHFLSPMNIALTAKLEQRVEAIVNQGLYKNADEFSLPPPLCSSRSRTTLARRFQLASPGKIDCLPAPGGEDSGEPTDMTQGDGKTFAGTVPH